MGVTRLVDLINTFSAQCCMSVGKSGHERVKQFLIKHYLDKFMLGTKRGAFDLNALSWIRLCLALTMRSIHN